MARLGFDLSRTGFAGLSKTWMLQRRFNWQLIMPHSIKGNLGMLVSQYCQDIRFGNYGISELSNLRYGGFQRFYSGLQNIETIILIFLAPIDNSVLEYFHGWYELMVDSSGYYYPKNNYARNIYVSLYDRSGVESVQFKLIGTFPTKKPVVDLSYREEDMLVYPVHLSVDQIVMDSTLGAIQGAIFNEAGNIAEKTFSLLGDVGDTVGGIVSQSGNVI